MSRPFLVLFTAGSGLEALTMYLQSHPFITVMPTRFDRERKTGLEPIPEAQRIAAVERRWQRYDKPNRRAFGVSLRVSAENGHLEADGAFLKKLLSYDPAVIVLRQDDILMQAVKRLSDQQGGGKAVFDLPDLRHALQAVKRDYEVLDQVAEKFGPVLEIAREDLADYGESLMESVERWLQVPHKPYAKPEDGSLSMPSVEQLAADDAPVIRLSERLNPA